MNRFLNSSFTEIEGDGKHETGNGEKTSPDLPKRRSDPYKARRYRLRKTKIVIRSWLKRFPCLEERVIRSWKDGVYLKAKMTWKLTSIQHAIQKTLPREIDTDKVFFFSPHQISFCALKEFNIIQFKGKVIDGDWDRLEKKFQDLDVYIAFKEVFFQEKDWRETLFYQRTLQEVRKGSYLWGCMDQHDLDRRCQDLVSLFQKIKKDGYRSQRELFLLDQNRYCDLMKREDEVVIDVGRRGDLLFNNGAHRLSIAKLLDVKKIPVKIAVRHPEWVQFIKESLHHKIVPGEHFDRFAHHPDLADLLASQGT